MKYSLLIPLIFLCSCSSSKTATDALNELNGTWKGICVNSAGTTAPPSGDYLVQEVTYDNGNYSSKTAHYTDKDCANPTTVVDTSSGTYTYIKDITTETGLTAKAINKQVILPADFQPKSIDSFVYIDNDTLYFGASSGDFEINVIFFDQPYTKVN